jgi:multidrug efflux pump
MSGVTMGQAVAVLEEQAQKLLPADFLARLPLGVASVRDRGNQLTITFAFALVVIFLVLAATHQARTHRLALRVRTAHRRGRAVHACAAGSVSREDVK